MGVSLQKGGNVSLEKIAPGMTLTTLGLGWNPRTTDGEKFDLDASAFMLGEDGKVLSDTSFIFYNNETSACGGVKYMGDNQDGAGDGDDEEIKIDLSKIPNDVAKILIAVTIHDADNRKQNFGQVDDAYIRVLNDNNNAEEVARYDLSEDAATETAVKFGELYRHNGSWKFKAIDQGYSGGLKALASDVGVNLA